MNRKHIAIGIIFIAIAAGYIYYQSFYSSYNYSLRRRAEIAAQNDAEIHVAVAWDMLNDRNFINGVKLAVKEVNAQGIKLNNKDGSTLAHIVLHEFDDNTNEKAESTWLSISNNPKIVAVVGHSSAASAIPASISYEYNGVLFISALATDPALTSHNLKYTFSINPCYQLLADKLIAYARSHKLFKLAIMYSRDDYGISFYQQFTSRLDSEFEIAASRSYYPLVEDIEYGNLNSKTDMIFQVMQAGFDAIILIGRDKLAAEMIRQFRSMGINQPILGTDGLDNEAIWNLPQPPTDQLIVTSLFAGNTPEATNDPETLRFIVNYQKTYGSEPEHSASQGYDAIKVLASAYQLTGSTIPIKVGATLRYNFQKAYNHYVFDLNGMATNKTIFIKEISDGKSKIIAPDFAP